MVTCLTLELARLSTISKQPPGAVTIQRSAIDNRTAIPALAASSIAAICADGPARSDANIEAARDPISIEMTRALFCINDPNLSLWTSERTRRQQ
jgi:hypothetical protein